MRTKWNLLSVLVCAILLSGCDLPFLRAKAGLQIVVNPQANIYLDGKVLGQSPFNSQTLKAGQYTVKVSATDPSLVPWEGKITLMPGAVTYIERQLATDPSKSHGHMLSYEKLTKKDSFEVSIISSPDTVSVAVDSAPLGFTPIKTDSVAVGPHTFTLTSPGYQDKVVRATVQAGQRLIINAQMSTQTIVTPSPTPTLIEPTPATTSATPTPTKVADITPLPKQASGSAVATPYVLILDTPTGFLRVRADSSSSATEVAKVNPGDKFPFVQKDSTSLWYQITYSGTSRGWVSAQYAKLFP